MYSFSRLLILASVIILPVHAQWQSAYYRDHVLVGKTYDVAAEEFIDSDSLTEMIAAQDIILLGETHSNPDHHQLQANIIQTLIDGGHALTLVLEMLNAGDDVETQQKSSEQLVQQLEKVSPGWDWPVYQPVINVARLAQLGLYGGNIDKPQQHLIMRDPQRCQFDIQAHSVNLCQALPASGQEYIKQTIYHSHCGYMPIEHTQGMEKLIDDNTKAVFAESLGNPAGNILDISAVADMAHKHGVPLMIDNTVPTPYLCRPIEYGADVVIHSLTKYMGGHGTSIGGIIVDSGQFPWAEHAQRFPMLNQPDPSYHGVVYTKDMGAAAFIGRARVVPLRNMGSAISPFNSFQILQGIETLPVRMDRHCDNALAVARYLQQHEHVSWVRFAGLDDHPDKALVDRYMAGRASAILSFGIKGGAEAGARFIDALNLVVRLVNIGDAKSLACHPTSTTHRQLSTEEKQAAGVSDDLIRLSIGIEHIDDIIADLAQALAQTS